MENITTVGTEATAAGKLFPAPAIICGTCGQVLELARIPMSIGVLAADGTVTVPACATCNTAKSAHRRIN